MLVDNIILICVPLPFLAFHPHQRVRSFSIFFTMQFFSFLACPKTCFVSVERVLIDIWCGYSAGFGTERHHHHIILEYVWISPSVSFLTLTKHTNLDFCNKRACLFAHGLRTLIVLGRRLINDYVRTVAGRQHQFRIFTQIPVGSFQCAECAASILNTLHRWPFRKKYK